MEFLLDPNIAYLVLVIAFLVAIMALFSPGTGALEIGALFALFLSGYFIYNLDINWWALVILVVGVFPFLIAMRVSRSRQSQYLLISSLAFLIGSIFLFRGEGGRPGVNPIISAIVSLLVTGFLWVVVRKSMEAITLKPSHPLGDLIGAIGEARTLIHTEGSVYVGGEDWSARSAQPIPPEARVRVVGREGFTLEVEPVEKPSPQPETIETPGQ